MTKDLDPLNEADYDAIEAAVMETERGRWFLAKYAERNRNSDTKVLLEAIKKLERSMQEGHAAPVPADADQIRFDLVDMADAITQTKREIALLRPEGEEGGGINAATEELDAIVTATETATQEILEAAESIQEITWTMREAGVNGDYCEQIDNLITTIYTDCSFQGITGQRTSKMVEVLHYLEKRLEAMRQSWGGDDVEPAPHELLAETGPDAHLLSGPQLEGERHDQNDVDLMMGSREEFFEAVVSPPGDSEPPEVLVSELAEDDVQVELDEEASPEEPLVEFAEEDLTEMVFEVDDTSEPQPEASGGRIVTVRKPSSNDTWRGGKLPEDAFASPEPADAETAPLSDLDDDDKQALFS